MRNSTSFFVLVLFLLCLVTSVWSKDLGFFGKDSFFGDENYYFDEEYVEDQSHSDHQEERVNFTHEVCRGSVVSTYSWDYDNYFALQAHDNKTNLHVKVRGYSDVYIILSPVGSNYESLYTIVLSNSKSTIFKTHSEDSHKTVATIHTPNILSEHFYRGFYIQFDLISGYLIVTTDAAEVPILVYKDPDPLDIKYYSFHTDFYGNKFHVAFECESNDKSTGTNTTIEKIDIMNSNSDYGAFGTPDPRIRKRLLENYDPLSQPYPGITTVTIPYISVIHYDIDDQAQTFEVHAWVVMSWIDQRLYWRNYSMYDSTGYLHFSKQEVWTPEITTYNTAKPHVMNDFADEAQVLVQSNGTVIWVPPVRFITNCKMNLLDWPVGDIQRCHIKIGSWTFHESELDLQFGPENNPRVLVMEFEGHKFPNNTQWLITNVKAQRHSMKYACCSEKYVDITYYFTLARQYSIFSYTLVFPVLFISLVSAFGFTFPVAGNSRITLAGFNVLIITAYMIYFRLRLPTIDHVPRIVKLFTWNLFITTFNLIITPILLHLIQAKGNSRIPDWAKTLLNSKFVTYISFGGQRLEPVRRNSLAKARNFLRKSDSEAVAVEDGTGKLSSTAGSGSSSDGGRKPKKSDWTSLVELLNKIFFTVFGFITLMLVFSVII